MTTWAYPTDSVLPWHNGVVEDQRFDRWLKKGIIAFVVLALLLPWLPLPIFEKPVQEKKRSTYTRLVIEEKKLPPPPKVVQKPVAKKKAVAPKPKAKAAKRQVVKPKPKPVTKAAPRVKTKPAPKRVVKPVDAAKLARDKAAKTGVLAMADDLAAMRQMVDVNKVKVRNMASGGTTAKTTDRKMLTAKASSSVGGLGSAALSSKTAGVALSGRETTRVAAPSSGMGAGAEESNHVAGDYSGRSSESVRRVMDANKGSIFSVYNRALRKDGSLAGKVLFNMVIEPSGAISSISLVSSELADQALVQKILARIKMINFGPEPVGQTKVNYSFDFLPY
ncbi:MAG: AgmX/PglI C-terminal domain-containing protein [Gammaproteobacteria bacterium]|nr:AgmX/PglI C-terminal domain-containing protein [Gammaproteobacteria bacterium]MBT8150272.1 AgmX/PglI C-terminal domain-containing protein [Gammaproteobacteria bacterium]NND39168.1 AgmX/PglI C-terminal domain-containing protein [Pseudomonadales bacterium]NNM12493.1 AgmX/PglI C-terminal domain-containing protein [Pseudomonadales bacterium]